MEGVYDEITSNENKNWAGGVRSVICAYPYFEILDPPLIILVNSPYNRVRPIRGKLSRI